MSRSCRLTRVGRWTDVGHRVQTSRVGYPSCNLQVLTTLGRRGYSGLFFHPLFDEVSPVK